MQPSVLAHHPTSFLRFLLGFFLCTCIASAQFTFNGQIFSNGLAIVDSPAGGSQLDAGENLAFAVDVSGDGELSPIASIPGSGLATRFDSLNVFLVSLSTQLNFTVATSPGLLTQELGSTVKHVNFDIPLCTPAGQYNLTLYEFSHIDGNPFFSITPIPLSISNPFPNGPCTTGLNPVQSYPQSSSPPPHNPFLPTVTVTLTGPTKTSTIIYISLQSGQTVTTTLSPTGSAIQPSSTNNNSGFFPVNGALANVPSRAAWLVWAIGISSFFFLRRTLG